MHDIIIWTQLQEVLEWLLNTYYGWVKNWGWAIVMLTITVRLVMLPLTIKQLRSTAAMQAIAPKIKQIQNKYKGKSSREDGQAKQAEIMALYKEHGVNPFASCLPLLFQIPIFIGLNSVLRYHVHPTGDTGFLFINNIFVAMKDLPAGQEYFLTGLYLLSMLGSTLLFSFMTDKNQKYMMAGVAVVFSLFIKGFTVGLVIYWITTNLWTIGQQGLIKRTMGHHFPHLQTKPKGGKGGTSKGGDDKGKGGSTAKSKPKPSAQGLVGQPQQSQGEHRWIPEEHRRQAVTDEQPQVEATGETIAEARWAAVHELERRYPQLDRDAINYQTVSEGERGMLGVGYEPARVVATLTVVPEGGAQEQAPEPEPVAVVSGPADPDEASQRLGELLESVIPAIAGDAQVTITRRQGELEAAVVGSDLGLLIGRHGHTIDALQYLANAMMHRHGHQVEVVIDAQGYRERRERTLHDVAVNAAVEARESGRPVTLEPMTSAERKIVHLRLKEFEGVGTESEGAEPNRCVVVLPVATGDSDEL